MLEVRFLFKHIFIVCFLVIAQFAFAQIHSGNFIHLGAVESQAELDFVKAKIAANEQPWKKSYDALATWAVAGNLAAVGTGEDAPRDLCKRGYANALLWHYTGNTVYADRAVAILNAWGSNFTGYTVTPGASTQSLLIAGWMGSLLGPTAELMRDYPGWTPTAKATMVNMFKTKFYPALNQMSTWNGNVDLTQIDAMLNIAVFCEDVTEFNLGITRLKARLPAFYYLSTDLPSSRNIAGVSFPNNWGEEGTGLLPVTYVNGLTQETCRDNNHHSQFAMAATVSALEVAWHQGVDLYTPNTTRMVAALELMAKQCRTLNMQGVCVNNVTRTDLYNTWEIGYSHYFMRMGVDMPETALLLKGPGRSTRNPLAESSWNIFFETVTHAEIVDVPLALCGTPKLGIDQSICGKTNITLNANVPTTNRTFVWFKDNVAIPAQTGPTLTITQGGTYRVEADSMGCKTLDNIVIKNILTVDLGADKVLCNPATQVLDAGSTNGAGVNFAWSTGATTQTISVTKPGTYSVTVSGVNCTSVSDNVVVTSKLLTTISDTTCTAGVVNLTTAEEGIYKWYDVASGGAALFTGDIYSPSITANKMYYVEDPGGTLANVGKTTVGAGTIWGGSSDVDFSDVGKINQLIVEKNITLNSIAVYVSAIGNVTLNLRQGGVAVHTKTVAVTGTGKQVIPLDFLVAPGTYVLDAVGTTATIGFEATGGAPAFPYVYTGYLTFTYNVAWSQTNTWYGYFYDITFTAGNVCARTPVSAVVDPLNAKCVGGNTTQTIPLEVGWNFISLNVTPADNSVAKLFTGLDVQQIKTANIFWLKGNTGLNLLTQLEVGAGYLVKMNVAGNLVVTGVPSTKQMSDFVLKKGWNLIGCPYQSASPLSTYFNTLNCVTVKNFDGFWEPAGAFNSIQNLQPGKGYYMFSK